MDALIKDLEANFLIQVIEGPNSDRQIPGTLNVSIHQADLSTTDGPIELVKEVKRVHGGHVDILVSNAGVNMRIQDIWDISVENFDKIMNINLRASFILVKAVVDDMKAVNWGRIIFVSSLSAYGGGLNGCRKFQE